MDFNRFQVTVARVELESVREQAQLTDRVHQFSLVTGIRFYDRAGERLYHYY